MSSVQLMDKTRKIGKLLHNNNSSKVVFNDICSVLREILASNVLVISRKGKVLGVGNLPGAAASGELLEELIRHEVGSFIDPKMCIRDRRWTAPEACPALRWWGFWEVR